MPEYSSRTSDVLGHEVHPGLGGPTWEDHHGSENVRESWKYS